MSALRLTALRLAAYVLDALRNGGRRSLPDLVAGKTVGRVEL